MSTRVYIYAGAPGDAALYLREQSALANCTEVFGTTWANEDCLRVTLDTPFPSEGERLLWAALCSLNDGGPVDLHACAASLDADSLTALWVAVGIAFGCASRVVGGELTEAKPCRGCRGEGRRLHGLAVCPTKCVDCGGTGTEVTPSAPDSKAALRVRHPGVMAAADLGYERAVGK